MRELDVRSEGLIEEVEDFSSGRRRGNKTKEQIRDDLTNCLKFADEKYSLAVQTYDLVRACVNFQLDKHIRHLDQDLRRFEADLDSKGDLDGETRRRKKASLPYEAPEPVRTTNTSRKRAALEPQLEPIPPTQRLGVEADMPIDPNEPTYCICNRVSFGEMVGCDSDDVGFTI